MKNKQVGTLLMGVSLLIGFIVFSFNKALKDIVADSCSHGSECAMWGTIELQTNISIGLVLFILFGGAYLFFSGKKINSPIESKKDHSEILKKLNENEKFVLDKIKEEDGSIFQSTLVEKTEFNKVKITRILDRLEGLNIIERKRRGMTNVVILK
ncbi:hypothetical protein HN706_01290 [Candidatus Woesearchaeota archaeon]|jgi:uncharacterized membrane protein|nr:hypothetical protein [Candidatus Woesearchaeota archaeon]MBT6734884.1 hypothetical protein [Candidatus Woesearchaeota archaeon]MBT7169601.1 hypothetical protein [Candidatus Woesearchaeota archaeon]MBT7474559.1 hypothetical protein [Candidatus Woesearchaeota archaeon]